MDRLLYDMEKGTLVLPQEWRRLLSRIARHQRLLELEAPSNILRTDLAMATAAMVEVTAWFSANVLEPSREAVNTLESARYRDDLARHLREHHKTLALPSMSEEQLHRMHDEATPGGAVECEAWFLAQDIEGGAD